MGVLHPRHEDPAHTRDPWKMSDSLTNQDEVHAIHEPLAKATYLPRMLDKQHMFTALRIEWDNRE